MFRELLVLSLAWIVGCGSEISSTETHADGGDGRDGGNDAAPLCSDTETYDKIAADRSYCSYWTESYAFSDCGVKVVSRMRDRDRETFRFDATTGKLIEHVLTTDASRTVVCATGPARSCMTRVDCSFVCFAGKHYIESPDCPIPVAATDAGDGG